MFNRSPLPRDEADQFVNLGRTPRAMSSAIEPAYLDIEISPARIWR